ncbi:hypothetical protein PHYSODRAFT_296743 [Phytophthora sojae]|uniref:Uncharacterized protein n=1 Tax=Phytophthora sojae (strain P6497) TaxID=1094619 RepID=G4YS80_PHYSP|nr:hypothetical protein PHYSODRAFT_296743 [Phytophthora sojae]EGZ24781.1 hypothetical protein PHYSODRAFT_296743 [Phytophthora sojae]|eukprot:XP_009520069.1 hypothetical protein PHYSODRAFT_296743 [Phytophthora sojae]
MKPSLARLTCAAADLRQKQLTLCLLPRLLQAARQYLRGRKPFLKAIRASSKEALVEAVNSAEQHSAEDIIRCAAYGPPFRLLQPHKIAAGRSCRGATCIIADVSNRPRSISLPLGAAAFKRAR